MNLVESE